MNASMKSMLTDLALPPIVADMWVDRSPIAGWTRAVSVPLESETALALLRLTRFLARFQAKWVPVSRPESALPSRVRARSDAKPVPTFAERALGTGIHFAGKRYGLRRSSGAAPLPAGTIFSPGWLARRAAELMVATATAYFGLSSQVSAADPSETSSDRAVTVAQTKRMCFVDTLQITGVLVPRNEILVRPDKEGLQISQVLVGAGDSVVSGQVLARLTQPDGQQSSGTGNAVQAPAAGVISSVSAVIGTMASARAEPLFRIAKQGEMELLAETPVNTLARLAPDQPVKVEIIGVGELAGKVRLFSTAINPTTQLGQVRLFIGSDQRLRAGVFGRATVEVGRRCGAAIPLSAILYGQGGAIVQVVRDSRVETRRVSVGLLAAEQAEIRDGLSEGDLVVARAGAFVRDGDRVRPITATVPSGRQ
jgi:HlyD family secretion protein